MDSKHQQFLVAPFQLDTWIGPFPVGDMGLPLSNPQTLIPSNGDNGSWSIYVDRSWGQVLR